MKAQRGAGWQPHNAGGAMQQENEAAVARAAEVVKWDAVAKAMSGRRMTAVEIARTMLATGVAGWTWPGKDPPTLDWVWLRLMAAYQRGKVNRRYVAPETVWWTP